MPLGVPECDDACVKHLAPGVINLTDGAAAYEAFAAGDVVCTPNCDRKDCLALASAGGHAGCKGTRARSGRDRFETHYKNLKLSHGIVSHKKAEWSLVKQVTVYNVDGTSEIMVLKHGTQVADGAWAEIAQSIPAGVHSSDHARIAEYVYAWAWRARRHGQDLFVTMGPLLRNL